MAKATAICICKTCGKEFEKSTTKHNRSEADNWEAWAVLHYDECPQCYGARKRAEESEKPLEIRIKVNVYYPAVIAIAGGNTMVHKDALKKAGYCWGEEPDSGIFGGLSISAPRHVWSKSVRLESADDWEPVCKRLAAEAQHLGAKLINDITIPDYRGMMTILEKRNSEADEMNAKISALDKPVRPEWVPDGRWNGKIYGSSRNGYSIYIDGKKHDISSDQKEELSNYSSQYDKYSEELRKIKSKCQ